MPVLCQDVTGDVEISYLVVPIRRRCNGGRPEICERQEEIAEEIRRYYRDCDTVLREGLPCKEIVETAKQLDIDIVIVSTRHYRIAYGASRNRLEAYPALMTSASTKRGAEADNPSRAKRPSCF
jgi:hypothetical protein